MCVCMCLLYVCRGPGISEKMVRCPVARVTDNLRYLASISQSECYVVLRYSLSKKLPHFILVRLHISSQDMCRIKLDFFSKM